MTLRFISLLALSVLLAVGCSSSSSKSDNRKECVAPANPYEKESNPGHYAGFDWAEKGKPCHDNPSQSFNEGCQEYERQEAEYQECQSKN